MTPIMTVYDSMDTREKMIEDHVRFRQSVEKLAKIGITVETVSISSQEDVAGCEAYDDIDNNGMGCLPITVYDGTVVDTGEYPSDQILADYLDVPDGTLSADRFRMPAANDREFSCCECRKC